MLSAKRGSPTPPSPKSYRDVDDFDAYFDSVGDPSHHRSQNSQSYKSPSNKAKSNSQPNAAPNGQRPVSDLRVQWANKESEEEVLVSSDSDNDSIEFRRPGLPRIIESSRERTGSFSSIVSFISSPNNTNREASSDVKRWFVIDPFVMAPTTDRWKFSDDELSSDVEKDETPASHKSSAKAPPKTIQTKQPQTKTTPQSQPKVTIQLPPSHKASSDDSLVSSPTSELPASQLPTSQQPRSEPVIPQRLELERRSSMDSRTGVKPSRWNQDAYPFRHHALAAPFRLPHKSEYAHRGRLLRAKGRWKRKWAQEHFIIQHNVLLTCTKEEPFLVKVCIPLKNIQSVEPLKTRGKKSSEPGRFFEIKYIQAARKGKERFAVMQCQAATAAEAQEWIGTIKRFRDRASSPATALVDFVVRENAEAAILQLHDAMKNSGLYQIVTRLCSAVSAEETDRIKAAFWKLRQNQMMGNLSKEKKEFEKGLKKAGEEVVVAQAAGAIQEAAAKRLARLGYFIQKLFSLVNSKRHLALMDLKRKTDLQYTQKTANDVQEVMLNALVVEHAMSANRQIQWRKKRMAVALESPFRRVLKEAFMTIDARGHIIETMKRLRHRAMMSLLRSRIADEKQTLTTTVSIWKTTTALQQRQSEAMKSLFLSRRKWDLHLAMRRWNAACICKNQKDIRACQILESMVRNHEQRVLGMALRGWSKWASEGEQLEALQIAANFNLVNDQIVSSFNRVPMERACHLFALGFRKMVSSRLAFGMHSIRTAAARNELRLRVCAIGGSLLEKAQRARLQGAFYSFVKFAFRCHYASSNRLIGLMQLTVSVRLLLKRKTSEALMLWRKNVGTDQILTARRPQLMADRCITPAAHLGDVLYRIGSSRLAFCFNSMKSHSREVDLLRGIARAQGLERICHLADRQRIAVVASAFSRLVYNTYPSSIIGIGELLSDGNVSLPSFSQQMMMGPHAKSDSIDTGLNRVSPTTGIPLSDTTEPGTSGRVTGLMGQLLWLGVGMTRGPDGRPQVLLQGHRAIRKSDLDDSRSVGLIQSQISPKAQWKRPGHHSTIRSLGIKKGVTPSKAFVTIRPRNGRLPSGPPPRKVLGLERIRSDMQRLGREMSSAGSSTHNNCDDQVIGEYIPAENFLFNSPYMSTEQSDSNPHLFGSDPMVSQSPTSQSPTPDLWRTSGAYRHHRRPYDFMTSAPIDRRTASSLLGGDIDLNTPFLGSKRLSERRRVGQTRPTMGEVPGTTSNIARIEEWIKSSQQYVRQPFTPERRLSSTSSVAIDPLPPTSSYLDFLLASSGSRYLQNATGETPDIDVDRIRDFVFDDEDGIRGIEGLDFNQFMEVESLSSHSIEQDEGRDFNSERSEVRGVPVLLENTHGQQKPDGYSTTAANTSSMEEVHDADPAPDLQTTTRHLLANVSQKAYRARIVPPLLAADGDSLEESRRSSRLVIVRGETGGACAAGDLAVIASNVPRRRKKKALHSRSANSRPADSRPADSRPADSRPADSRPADSRPDIGETSHQNFSERRHPSARLPEHRVVLGPVEIRKVEEVGQGIPVTPSLVDSISYRKKTNSKEVENSSSTKIVSNKIISHRRRVVNLNDYPGIKINTSNRFSQQLVVSPRF